MKQLIVDYLPFEVRPEQINESMKENSGKLNVKVVLQNKSVFMNACFESIKYVKTDYCTFLYDDDEISPYAVEIFKKVYNENLSMGYGIVCDQNTKSKFKPINIPPTTVNAFITFLPISFNLSLSPSINA